MHTLVSNQFLLSNERLLQSSIKRYRNINDVLITLNTTTNVESNIKAD